MHDALHHLRGRPALYSEHPTLLLASFALILSSWLTLGLYEFRGTELTEFGAELSRSSDGEFHQQLLLNEQETNFRQKQPAIVLTTSRSHARLAAQYLV